MSKIPSMPLVVSLILAAAGPACVLRGPGDVRRELVQQTGVRLDRKFGLTLGRVSMAMARVVVRASGEDEIPIRGVHHVQIGVYRVVDGGPPARPLDPGGFGDEDTWQPIVRVHDGGDDVLVLIRQREESVRGMLVLVQDADEVVIVRLRGRLERVVEDAMRYALAEGGREDLWEVARADYEQRAEGLAPDEPLPL